MTTAAESALKFDQESHTYTVGDRVLPSVTQLLNQAAMVELPPLNDPRVIRKRIIGKQVHLACQYIDEGGVNWDELDPACRGYVEAYWQFKQDTNFQPWLIEHRFTAKCHGVQYAGTLDRTGLLHGYPYLIDLKTPLAAAPHWSLQTAGYAIGITPPSVRPFYWQRAALQLRPSGKYRLVSYADPVDFDVFAAMLQSLNHPAVLRWKANNHIAVEEDY